MTTTVFNTNINEVEKKIPTISSLVSITVLNTKIGEVDNKIPDHAKYIITPEFNKLTAENFTARLKEADSVLIITSIKTKHLEVQKKLNILITKDSNYFLERIVLQVMMGLKARLFSNHHLIL